MDGCMHACMHGWMDGCADEEMKEGRKEGRKLTAANTTPRIKSARPQQSKADSVQVSAEVPLMSTCGSEHCWHEAERMLPG